jgi:hypothetical protein
MKRALAAALGAAALATVTTATALSAQTAILVARADSLLMAGEVVRAEALYYAVSRRNPRDTQGRAALGQYLASRGAFKIGATLLEEALAFGGDTAALAQRRAPVLQAGDEWVDLAQLSHSPLPAAQRERARWLATHAPAVSGADSVTVAFEPSSAEGLGRVQLVVGSDTLAADIDPSSDELALGDYAHFAKLVQVFSGEGGGRVGVLLRATIGDLVLERMPARFDPQLGSARARIGLTLLAKLAPTVDAAAGVLTLRREGSIGEMTGRRRIPVFFAFPGVLVARADRLVRIESPAGRALLATARWTLDLRRGELVLEVDR